MLISFFDVDGIVHREFVSPGHTVNHKFHLNVLKIARSLQQNHPENDRVGIGFCTMTMPPPT